LKDDRKPIDQPRSPQQNHWQNRQHTTSPRYLTATPHTGRPFDRPQGSLESSIPKLDPLARYTG